jgi:predicted transcriptional regulator
VIRALVARELVSKHGYSKKRAAQLLGVTPSAVTLYLKGIRGAKLESHAFLIQARPLISDAAERLSKDIPEELRGVLVLEVAQQLVSMLKGTRFLTESQSPRGETKPSDQRKTVLQGRLRVELAAAQSSLKAASTLNDEFGKLLFREIASDSMRMPKLFLSYWRVLTKG